MFRIPAAIVNHVNECVMRTLLMEHIASAKNTSMKGTDLGLPCIHEHLGLSNSPARLRTVLQANRIHAVEGNGIKIPTNVKK